MIWVLNIRINKRQGAAEMSVDHSTTPDNPSSCDYPSPEAVAETLRLAADCLRQAIPRAVAQGQSFDDTERSVRDALRQIGSQAMQLFLALQGDGDLGEQVTTDQDVTLKRGERKSTTSIRSIFGQHTFDQFTYSRGKNKSIEMRPISARMQLPPHRWSFLLRKTSQVFCAEAAFNQAADHLELVLGGQFSVDTLEKVNGQMGLPRAFSWTICPGPIRCRRPSISSRRPTAKESRC